MKLLPCLAVDTSAEAAARVTQLWFSPASSGPTIGSRHHHFSCSRMSCGDENRLSSTPPQPREEKRSDSTMSVGGIQWDVGDRIDLGFMVRETWVSIPALSLNLLSFCFLLGEVETRIWLVLCWGLGGKVYIRAWCCRLCLLTHFILTTNPRSRYYRYLHFAEEETEEGDYVTCPRSCI